MSRTMLTVRADEVKPGDMLSGLGDGEVTYVNDYAYVDGMVTIGFADKDGEDCYLNLTPTVPLTVWRMP
jgi:hypothetical protein